MKFLVIIFLLVVVGFGSFYIVPEGRQAIITEFGKPVGGAITQTGIHLKKPFIQEVRFVDKRILSWDGYPNNIPTKDKKFIYIDTTARWRIVDVLKFIQTVQNENGAKARLDAILDAATRNVVSGANLVETVRNSNSISEKIEAIKNKEKESDTKIVIEEQSSVDIEMIEKGREELSKQIAKAAMSDLKSFGIELVDVQLKRVNYTDAVQENIFRRMISERKRIAEKIRSMGKGEKAKIEGRLSRDLQEIESSAYRESQIIKGKAEAKAINIYAKSMKQDPKFYEFIRSMEAYKKTMKRDKSFILSSDSDFLKFLKRKNI